MKHVLTAVANRTRSFTVYKRFCDRRKLRRITRQFSNWTAEDQIRCDFYRQFVSAGDTVFDVGANLGNRSKLFYRLGAVVIAVEPQGSCADFLQSVFADAAGVHVVRKALGSAVGQSEMFISNSHTISSLSHEWIQSVTESRRFGEQQWNRRETISIDTLDNLIVQFGRPEFVKIDVEGFEDQVIAGLTTKVPALSLEFTPEFMESTLKCISHLCSLGHCRFQLCLGESMKFELASWVDRVRIESVLSEIPKTAFGDLYARFVD